ncbi:MAG: molybdate ABC transporter substrate-binding protein, partial [Rhodoferax sp.]|nr:molybdate ABC transporter substrate-binding protein [Rhodoferax sp.]
SNSPWPYAQIVNGAPFQVPLSGDAHPPAQLLKDQLAVRGSDFTYANVRLVLWSPLINLVDPARNVLQKGNFSHLAMAYRKVAPYGRAAQEVLLHKGLSPQLRTRILLEQDIAQTHQFIASGTVPMEFVALSQGFENGRLVTCSAWVVPSSGLAKPAFYLWQSFDWSDHLLATVCRTNHTKYVRGQGKTSHGSGRHLARKSDRCVFFRHTAARTTRIGHDRDHELYPYYGRVWSGADDRSQYP